jgi:hypothetical protein
MKIGLEVFARHEVKKQIASKTDNFTHPSSGLLSYQGAVCPAIDRTNLYMLTALVLWTEKLSVSCPLHENERQ